jgi:Flp pilus assembly protein CpaB
MRRGRILILVGLILAIGTAAAVFVLLRGFGQPGPAEVAEEEVVVAIQPIDADQPVEGRVQIQARPKDSIPEDAIRSIEATAGMLAAYPIAQDMILRNDYLISPAEFAKQGILGKLVEEGFVAVAFPVSELSSVSYGIKPDDSVDILMTFFFVDLDQETQTKEPICPPICPAPVAGEEGTVATGSQYPRLATQLTVQNARVLGVGRWAYKEQPTEEQAQATAEGEPIPEQPPQFITLMLTPQDALVLKLAREYGASIDLAVRAENDLQIFSTQQVTLDYILARFGISLPTKQPYALDSISPQAGE